MGKLYVTGWHKTLGVHICLTEQKHEKYIDFVASGNYQQSLDPLKLIGKTIQYVYLRTAVKVKIEIPHGSRIIEEMENAES